MSYHLGDTLLKTNNLSLSFGDKKVLRDISLEIRDIINPNSTTGQVVTLLGPSGIGKTQLLKMIAGLMPPSAGEILIKGSPVRYGVVGMVLQTYPLFKHRTLLGNLELVSKDKEKISFYLNEFNIFDHRNKYPSHLSGGQRQRTAIVQQLLCSDHFILLDEPLSGLDPVATDKLCENVQKIVSLHEHNTVIISTHILEPAIAISDSIWMIGNERDAEGGKVEGAIIKHTFDLAANGLAWRPDIRKDKQFHEVVEGVRDIFHTL
jgi:ABC-type nitrate/sulfonate/bicarbonate transport system ATPase subunit